MISWAIQVMNINQNAKKAPHVIKKLNAEFWITFNFWWSAEWSERWKLTEMWKKAPMSSKNKMFIFGLRSTSDDWPSNPSKKHWLKCKRNQKEGPLSHRKIKCSFWIMISQAIQAKNVNWNVKKTKRPHKSLKNKMFIFGLHSTSDDQPSDSSKKCWPKCKKTKKALSHWKIKCSFLDYIQLLMIGRVIWVMNGDWNAKRGLLSHQKWNAHFLMVYQKTSRRLPEDCQKTSRRLPEDHQKASGLSSGSLLTLWYKEISIKDYTSTWTAVP